MISQLLFQVQNYKRQLNRLDGVKNHLSWVNYCRRSFFYCRNEIKLKYLTLRHNMTSYVSPRRTLKRNSPTWSVSLSNFFLCFPHEPQSRHGWERKNRNQGRWVITWKWSKAIKVSWRNCATMFKPWKFLPLFEFKKSLFTLTSLESTLV